MLKKLSTVIFVLFVFLVTAQVGMSRSRPSRRRIHKNARHIVRRIVKQVKQNVRKRRGRIISKKVREAIRRWRSLDLSMELLGSEGITIADENGLTFIIDGITLPLVPIIYDAQYWGKYPLYRSGSMMVVRVTIKNKGKGPELLDLMIKCTAFDLNTDGSNGDEIMTPQTKNISVANGETVTTDMIFPSPDKAENLNRLIVSIYTEGTLLMTKEGIFCPPGELK